MYRITHERWLVIKDNVRHRNDEWLEDEASQWEEEARKHFAPSFSVSWNLNFPPDSRKCEQVCLFFRFYLLVYARTFVEILCLANIFAEMLICQFRYVYGKEKLPMFVRVYMTRHQCVIYVRISRSRISSPCVVRIITKQKIFVALSTRY